MQNQDRVPETIPETAEGMTPEHDGKEVPTFTWFNRAILQQRKSSNVFNNSTNDGNVGGTKCFEPEEETPVVRQLIQIETEIVSPMGHLNQPAEQ